jgi:hypothetical protein
MMMTNQDRACYLGKILVFLVLLYFPQQFLHEAGHVFICKLLGGTSSLNEFGIDGASCTCYNITRLPVWSFLCTKTYLYFGGLIAFIVLFFLTRLWKNYWLELRTITLTYSLGNLFLSILEGTFNGFYENYPYLSNYLILPGFFSAIYLLKEEYNQTTE